MARVLSRLPMPISLPMITAEAAATPKMPAVIMRSMPPAMVCAEMISVLMAMWPMITVNIEVPKPQSDSLSSTGVEYLMKLRKMSIPGRAMQRHCSGTRVLRRA